MEMMRVKRGIYYLLFVCTVALFLLVLDIVAASVYKACYLESIYSRDRRIHQRAGKDFSYRVKSLIYHHGLIPNRSVDGVMWGPEECSYKINSLGLRDKAVCYVPLKSDSYRILFIGDSFTEGSGVDYEDTFVGIVDENSSKIGAEIYNAAVSSYSPIIYWRKVKYLIEKKRFDFNELVVFLDVSDIYNEAKDYYLDPEGNVKNLIFPETKTERLKNFLKDNTMLTQFFREQISARLRHNLTKYEGADWITDSKVYEEYGAKGLELMVFYMDRLYKLLQENGIRLTVAVYPWPIQIIKGSNNSFYVSFWRDWCAGREVDFIDYFQVFETLAYKNEQKKIIYQFYLEGDIHFSKKGHKLIADHFLKYLKERNAPPFI